MDIIKTRLQHCHCHQKQENRNEVYAKKEKQQLPVAGNQKKEEGNKIKGERQVLIRSGKRSKKQTTSTTKEKDLRGT